MSCVRMLLMAVVTLSVLAHGRVDAADPVNGPKPYPEDAKDWPGRGVIRTFPYMAGIRERYWKQREEDRGAVVFVGSSSTEGWKDLAETFPTLKVANRGIGGDTSRGVLFRFQEDVLDLQPGAIVMLVGQNDLTAHGSPQDTAANIERMLEMAAQQNAAMPVVLCTIPPSANPKAPVKPEQRQQLNDRIKELAAGRENVVLCDVHAAFANPDGSPDAALLGADVLHFGPAGYARWAEILRPILESLKLEPEK